MTSPDYRRIYDHELVTAVQRIAGNGIGDTRWKVPGVLDWSTGIYNPRVDVTTETTTLYASDRDVFLFLVDDLSPIEAGLLSDGSSGFSQGHRHAQSPAALIRADADGREHGDIAHNSAMAHLFMARIDNEVPDLAKRAVAPG